MSDLFSSIPTTYDLDKVGSYVVAGQNPVLKRLFPFRNIPLPEPGFWLMRQHRKGPWCPAAILRLQTKHEPGDPENRMERSPFFAAYISGEPVKLEDVWHARGRPISEDKYWQQVRHLAWCRKVNEYDPRLHPREPIKMEAISP